MSYEYAGKTWHVRFIFDYEDELELDEIDGIFARCHCDNQVHGYSFHASAMNNAIYYDRHIDYSLEPYVLESFGDRVNKSYTSESILTKILKDGRRTDSIEVPKVVANSEAREKIGQFFERYPELIPPYFERQPTEPPNPTQTPPPGTSTSYWKWAVATSIFVIAAVYLVVKYNSQEPAQTPMKSR